MFVRDYEWYIRHLAEHVNLKESDVDIVEDVPEWCREHGVAENDGHRPLRLVKRNGAGAHFVIASMIPDAVVNERITALRIRSQLRSVSQDRADMLNSDTKKIAYLFLREFASTIPDLASDDLAADDWVFEQMGRIGMFKV